MRLLENLIVYDQYVSNAGISWQQHPYNCGGVAIFKAGDIANLVPYLATPEHRICFAGEHTSSYPGWVEGAIESGIRAAVEVHQLR